ncbi:MAG: radical SAM family heme chaperone HemW [Pseudomonadales bacterium]|nr:radical SAM family heme chaperone HemW [Pseudomonadales bacterium]
MLGQCALYIHFPWCIVKCPYCDFNSHPLKERTDFADYTTALIKDWQSQQANFNLTESFASVFVGGGTPSLFDPKNLHQTLSAMPIAPGAEVTMELNPGTAEYTLFQDTLKAGVNRLSIGAQSFDNHALKRLGRIHRADETVTAFELARKDGFSNINLDIMWGLPGQTVTQAMTDLDTAIALEPDHISWYQLTIEAKTEFSRRTPLLPVDATLAEIEARGLDKLALAGYARYEVSAFTKPGKHCQHNVNYWSFGDYVGIGAGAHGKLSSRQSGTLRVSRTTKFSQPRRYLQSPQVTQKTTVAQDQLPVEFMLNALRQVDGVSLEHFSNATGLPWRTVEDTWEALVDRGLVQENQCATTALGLRYLDTIVAEFLV